MKQKTRYVLRNDLFPVLSELTTSQAAGGGGGGGGGGAESKSPKPVHEGFGKGVEEGEEEEEVMNKRT